MTVFNLKLTGILAVAAMGIATASPAQAKDRHRHHDDDDKVAGVVAGVAIAGAIAAIAAKKKRNDNWERDHYYRDDRRYYRNNRWGETFRPRGTENTICYRRARTCYKKGHYSSKWTIREFGYDRRY